MVTVPMAKNNTDSFSPVLYDNFGSAVGSVPFSQSGYQAEREVPTDALQVHHIEENYSSVGSSTRY